MTYFKDLETRGAHPGWAVYFEDGTWLGGAHGFIRTGDAFSAYIYDTKEQAERVLDFLRNSKTESQYFSFPANIIEAWQPACENLRAEVLSLKQVSIVNHLDVYDLRETLESALDKVKGWQEKGKTIPPDVNWEGLALFLGCSVEDVKTKLLADNGKEQRRAQINLAVENAQAQDLYDIVEHQINLIDEDKS